MQSGYVIINNVPSRVATCGGWIDVFEKSNPPQDLVLIIPGNPGLTAYYEEFIIHLYELVHKPVWVICHAGHEIDTKEEMPPVKEFPMLFDLEGQICHKVEFIKRYIPKDVTIHLIGHSVGSYINLHILKHKLVPNPIAQYFMLFPAIEHIGTTTNGRIYQIFANYFLWLILLLATVFTVLPKVVQVVLVKMYFLIAQIPTKNMAATLHLVNPVVLKHIFFLASDEMRKILDLDIDTITNNKDKMTFYYSPIDRWCPIRNYYELQKTIPDIRAFRVQMRHAFVLDSSNEMATMLSEWIT